MNRHKPPEPVGFLFTDIFADFFDELCVAVTGCPAVFKIFNTVASAENEPEIPRE